MDLVEPHQNRNQIREKIFPFIIELTVPLPQCTAAKNTLYFVVQTLLLHAMLISLPAGTLPLATKLNTDF